MPRVLVLLCLSLLLLPGSLPADDNRHFDVLVRGGTVYDGSGEPGVNADVGILGDRIAAIGDLGEATADTVVDATGKAVSPGFINMLSWAINSLIVDGRGMGDLVQGVTLEVFGEGWSQGPWNESLKQRARDRQNDFHYDIEWTTLGEYLQYLEDRGVSPNVASFVGATTLRVHEVGYDNRPASDEELARMQALVRQAMEEGALGVGSSLIYAPANFADTAELTALVAAAAEYDGMYISHLRSEAGQLLEAVQELIDIARATGARAEIYHLKAGGEENWPKLDQAIAMVDAARAEGLPITADMYTYPASSTGLNAAMPLWVQEGGHDAWVTRLQDPAVRARVIDEMRNGADGFENRVAHAGGPSGVLLVDFRNPELRPLIGKTIAEVAAERGTSPEDTIIDLVIEDDSRVGVIYFIMSEANVAKKVAVPWVSFGSDASAMAPEGLFLNQSTHPRAYGTFARVLGKYVREEQVITLAEAIRKLTALPAENLRLADRGRLAPGYFADVVVFDPVTVTDHATFAEPHQLATGVSHVFVNGVQTLADGEHTGATAGRFVKGPGWTGASDSVTWRLDNLETIGGHAVTVVGDPQVIETADGKALAFDGDGDGIFLDLHPLEGQETFTVEVTFRPDGDGPFEQRFFHMQEDGTESRVMFETRVRDDGQWFLDTFINAGGEKVTLFAEHDLHPVDQWQHAAIVVADGRFRHYVNGVLELDEPLDYSPQGPGRTSLGMRINEVHWFRGAIRTVRFTPGALSPADFLDARD